MGLSGRILLLILIVLGFSQASAADQALKIAIGDKLEELRLPAAKGYGFSLKEQLGKPVMLIWVGDCDTCSSAVKDYSEVASRYEKDNLVTRVIWDADGKSYSSAPSLDLPVLVYDDSLPSTWKVDPVPAVMLISPDGVLDYAFIGNLNRNLEFTNRALAAWLSRNGMEHQR
jgi:hypothetical protein